MPRMIDRPKYASRWTAEDFRLLEIALKEGRTISEIAKTLGRSQEAVRNKAWQKGLLPSRKQK